MSWIAFKEQAPPSEVLILVYDQRQGSRVGSVIEMPKGNYAVIDRECSVFSNPTHWQPLPDAPNK